MSTGTIESLLDPSNSQPEMLGSQGSLPRKKDEVKRLRMRIGTFKGSLTTETKKFISFVDYYEKKFPQDDETDHIRTAKIDYAASILKSFNRVTDQYVALENTLDQLKTLMSDIWEESEDELETAISKLDEGFQKYEKEYIDTIRKNDTTIERCKNILIKSSLAKSITETATAPSTTENRTTGARPQLGFRPQADLKLIFLTKEFTEFTKAYIIYMQSSGTTVPRDAVCSYLRVH